MLSRFKRLLLILFIISGLAVSASSEINSNKHIPNQIRNGGVGVKLGVLNTGTYTVGTRELDPQPSITGGVFFEFNTGLGFMISPAFDLNNISISGLNKIMGDINLQIKPILYNHNVGYAIKPCIGVGLGHISLSEINELRAPSTYLSVKAMIEIAFFSHANHAWLLEVGYLAYPTGGNKYVDASISPSLIVRVGVMY